MRAENGNKVRTLSPKTINDFLTILRRMLVVAYKRSLVDNVPEVEWLKTSKTEFGFFDFDEAERLLAAGGRCVAPRERRGGTSERRSPARVARSRSVTMCSMRSGSIGSFAGRSYSAGWTLRLNRKRVTATVVALLG